MVETKEILVDLLKIDSRCTKSNKEIIDYIQGKLSSFDSEVFPYKKGELFLYNLIVKIPGESSDNPIVFAGHTDTVPPTNGWNKDPFNPFVEDMKIYGLGASDMKSGLACMISAILNLKGNPKNDTYLLFDADEEEGLTGGNKMIEDFFINNARVIIPEPTDNKIIYQQKGCLDMRITFFGEAKHSSRADSNYHKIKNAINRAIRFCNKIVDYGIEIEKKEDSLLGRPTINIGIISGGTGANVVPDRCSVSLCRRIIPEENIQEEFDLISKYAKDIDFEDGVSKNSKKVKIEPIFWGGPFKTDPESEFVKTIFQIAEKNSIKTSLDVKQSWTEAALFAKYGETIIFGPGLTGQCHVANEYAYLEDLEKFTSAYKDIINS